MSHDFPDDADGEVLRRLADDGVDLSTPREVDFTIYAPDESTAKSLLERIGSMGYSPRLCIDEQDGSISLYCTIVMALTYDAVIERQEQLNAICRPVGAECDGWLAQSSSGPSH
jgi:hypothetical protein